MAEEYDIQHDQGATYAQQFIWKTDTATPTPVDLTGYTARMHLRETKADPDVILELTTENGRIALGDATGVVDLLITADDTSSVPAASYRYDLELESPTGFVTRLIEGKFKMVQEVTRPEGTT